MSQSCWWIVVLLHSDSWAKSDQLLILVRHLEVKSGIYRSSLEFDFISNRCETFYTGQTLNWQLKTGGRAIQMTQNPLNYFIYFYIYWVSILWGQKTCRALCVSAVLVYFLSSVHESWLLVVGRFVAADDVGKQECPSKIQEVNVHNTTLCNDCCFKRGANIFHCHKYL